MSIPDNAFAGKDEKRVNITVRTTVGPLPNVPCFVFTADGNTQITSTAVKTNTAGKAGIWFPDSFNSIQVKCNGTFSGAFDTLKHTTFVNIQIN